TLALRAFLKATDCDLIRTHLCGIVAVLRPVVDLVVLGTLKLSSIRMIEIENSETLPSQQFLQRCLTLDERWGAQVSSVEVEESERDEHTLTAEKQITKDRPSIIIETSNLAVEHGAVNVKMLGEP